jgi:DNA modification methylase
MDYILLEGKSEEQLLELDENSVDSCITDPPYGLGKEPDPMEVMKDWIEKGYHEVKSKGGFMGKEWDSFVPQPKLWKEVFRVLKPGGYMLVACGTRTEDWMAMSLRFAGFEIRDVITWHYGSGFPKSHDISKAIDKRNGRFYDESFKKYANECRNQKGYSLNQINELLCVSTNGGGVASALMGDKENNELPTLEMYEKLKVILEMDNRFDELIKTTEAEREVIGERKQRANSENSNVKFNQSAGEVELITTASTEEAKQWEGWGTALKPATEFWILARKPLAESTVAENVLKYGTGGINIDDCRIETDEIIEDKQKEKVQGNVYGEYNKRVGGNGNGTTHPQGRFPANLILDEFAANELDKQSGILKSGSIKQGQSQGTNFQQTHSRVAQYDKPADSGGASRFFYVAKASKSERNAGCDNLPDKNNHCTVKPITLMRYLIKLITPKGGTVLDPFNGSGTTGCACALEKDLDLIYIGIDNEPDYIKISEARIEHWIKEAEKK